MIKGTVIGQVWATKRLANVPTGALLEIKTPNGVIIAFDALGCGVGEQVLVTQGTVASAYFDQTDSLVDALIIGSIDT